MAHTLYHKLLRICALTLAIVLLFVSGIFSPVTQQLSQNAGSYVATAIGINAAVMPNEVNTLSAQLVQREAELTQREIDVQLRESQSSSDTTTYILSIILFIMLVLIVLNYVLDYVRTKKTSQLTTA